MRPWRIRAAAWRLAALALAGLVVGCSGGDDPVAPTAQPPGETAAPHPAPTETQESAPLRSMTIEVYFPSARGDGLVGEYGEIFETVTAGDRVKQIVADLISGPTNPEALRALPAGTTLRQAYVLDSGICYLDFSRDLSEGMGGGSMEELLTVYSIVDSVVHNVAEVRRVGILVEGEPVDTLNGHMDLRRPLAPDRSLILAPIVVDNRAGGERPADRPL